MNNRTIQCSKLIFFSLPSLTVLGWIIFLSWIVGFESIWIVRALFLVTVYILFKKLKTVSWDRSDLRWLVAPAVVFLLAIFLPWWDYTIAWQDASYHILQSLNFSGYSEWIPNGLYLDRSPIVPAVLSFEFLFGSKIDEIFVIPLFLFITSAWQIQHFSERYVSKTTSILCVLLFILLPTVRFWGQMAMTDVPVAGMWFFCLAIFIDSEKEPINNRLSVLLGASVGLIFLTKFTFIYMTGLIGWFLIRDRNFVRISNFAIAWFVICLPFLLYQFLKFHNPFHAISGKVHFTKESSYRNVGAYDAVSFVDDVALNLNLFILSCSVIGILLLRYKDKVESTAIFVLTVPLVVLNGLVLDWGEPRYNIPLFGLGLVLSMICLESKFNEPLRKKVRWFPHVCSLIIFCSLISHVIEIPDEIQKASVLNENFDDWTQFEIQPLNELDDSDLVLAGRSSSISLYSSIPTLRFDNPVKKSSFEPTGDLLTDSILSNEPTHILTTNVAPWGSFEKSFNYQLGHPMIEFQSVAIGDGIANAWWSSVLWEVNQTEYLQPDQVFSTHNGTLFGDLIVLAPNESFTVGDDNLSIKWVEVTSKRPDQQVLRILGGEIGLIQNGSIHNPDLASFSSGQELMSPPDKYIYAWVEYNL